MAICWAKGDLDKKRRNSRGNQVAALSFCTVERWGAWFAPPANQRLLMIT